MKRFPDMTIPDEPLTVVQRVYAKGEPLGGNICPPVGPHPFHPPLYPEEICDISYPIKDASQSIPRAVCREHLPLHVHVLI